MELVKVKTELKKLVPDFAKRVAPVYTLMDWEWSPMDKPAHIPDSKEIENTLDNLIDGLNEEDTGNSTGGLYVEYDIENGECGISFRIEEVHSF